MNFALFVCPDCKYVGATWNELGVINVVNHLHYDNGIVAFSESYRDYESTHDECPECGASYSAQTVLVIYENNKLEFDNYIWDKNELIKLLLDEKYLTLSDVASILSGTNLELPKYNLDKKYVWK
jgi:hypothetical protein